jgi:hypothetical protein
VASVDPGAEFLETLRLHLAVLPSDFDPSFSEFLLGRHAVQKHVEQEPEVTRLFDLSGNFLPAEWALAVSVVLLRHG